MATRYKTRITILKDAEIEELYGRPRFTHDERVHYFALTPQERAVADGHYSLASRVLFILQAGYFKAKTLFFSFRIDEVADDVKHVLQQHYPRFHDAPLKSAVFKQTRHAQQRKLLELYDYRACVGAERAALVAKADHVVRISAKPIFVFQALVQYLETHRVVAPGYSFLQDVVSRALGKERARLTSLLDARLDEATRKMLDRLYLERDAGYAVTPLKQDPKDFSRREMRREMRLAAGCWSPCTEPQRRCCPSWAFPTTASPITRRWSITTPCRSCSNCRWAWHGSTCCAFCCTATRRSTTT